MRISKTFYFDAAHHLPNYDGPCRRTHGHTFKVEITFTGEKDKKTGMLIDFAVLKDIWENDVEPYLDHQDLNDILKNPTAENIAEWIYVRMFEYAVKFWNYDLCLEKVVVWESPTSCAEYNLVDWVEDYPEESDKYLDSISE